MGGLVDLFGGGVLTAIVLAALGALLLVLAIGAFVVWQRRTDERPVGAAPRNARLAVSETAIVAGGRRLVLVRRDNVEHLLLIGGPRDVVVESNIVRQRAAAMAPGPRAAAPRPAQPQALRPAATAASAAAPAASTPAASTPAASAPAAGAAPPAERAVDPAVQERLRAASTALALRHAGLPAQADQPAAKRDQVDVQVPPSSAVAGLAAGVAALTAAAGSSPRPAPPGDGKAAARKTEPAQPEKAVKAEAGSGKPQRGVDAETPAPAADGESAAEEEPGRAAFGLRDSTPTPSASDEPQAAVEEEALHASPREAPADAPDAPPPPAGKSGADAGEPERVPQESQAPAATEAKAGRASDEHQPQGDSPRPATEAGATPAEDKAKPPPTAAPQPREAPVTAAAPAAAEEAAEQRREPAMPTGSPAAPSPQAGPPPLSGLAPGRGTTLGDLAERLEEALIQQAATGAESELGQPGAVADEAMPPSPAPPRRDEASASGEHPSGSAAERDEAAVIDFAARRKPGNESLEEEMARLLGELTRDTTRR